MQLATYTYVLRTTYLSHTIHVHMQVLDWYLAIAIYSYRPLLILAIAMAESIATQRLQTMQRNCNSLWRSQNPFQKKDRWRIQTVCLDHCNPKYLVLAPLAQSISVVNLYGYKIRPLVVAGFTMQSSDWHMIQQICYSSSVTRGQ